LGEVGGPGLLFEERGFPVGFVAQPGAGIAPKRSQASTTALAQGQDRSIFRTRLRAWLVSRARTRRIIARSESGSAAASSACPSRLTLGFLERAGASPCHCRLSFDADVSRPCARGLCRARWRRRARLEPKEVSRPRTAPRCRISSKLGSRLGAADRRCVQTSAVARRIGTEKPSISAPLPACSLLPQSWEQIQVKPMITFR
jgi:hypothetical protein